MLVTINYHAYIWELNMVDESIENILLSFHFYKIWFLIKVNLYDFDGNDKILYMKALEVILFIEYFKLFIMPSLFRNWNIILLRYL